MTKSALPTTVLFAVLFVSGVTAAAAAQTVTADLHHPTLTVVQAAPEDTAGQSGGLQPAQPGTMPPRMMGQGMMGGMMQPGMMNAMPMIGMRGHMMKIMFAVADVDGDGGLSFEEVTAIHKRIFDKIDADKDGKVTLEESQLFMRE